MKMEYHHKYGVIIKRQRMVYDENDQDDSEFAKEVAGSLGDFSIGNQWFVDNLTEQLQEKCLLVENLKNMIYAIEKTIKNIMNQDFEEIRASYQQQIKQLQDYLNVLQ
jgi:ABC-type phosphate transport system auxiliary subunit